MPIRASDFSIFQFFPTIFFWFFKVSLHELCQIREAESNAFQPIFVSLLLCYMSLIECRRERQRRLPSGLDAPNLVLDKC